jgi:hypothetical protein
MNKCFLILILFLLTSGLVMGQIRVHPTGVNVNASGATTVFLTFGGLDGYTPVEAFWCGEVVDAFPDFGSRCAPGTIYGTLPIRYDISTLSGTNGFTDIMTIPPSVARRAYQSAQQGANSAFFYVRRFERTGSVDVYVAVTCRLAGGGARVPFALLDVRMGFDREAPLLSVQQGEPMPDVFAEIAYNGTGQLRGRWELVKPGETPPEIRDLLTEASLPIEERVRQRRYTELERFSLFLPPSTQPFRLPGPDPASLPSDVEGLYQILLRIEATDDKEGDSDLAAAGAGQGVVHSGAVAGFPIPPLRYYVGGAASELVPAISGTLETLLPVDQAVLDPSQSLLFSWTPISYAALYRLEIQTSENELILSALIPAGVESYQAPPWLRDKTPDGKLIWRVLAIDFGANEIGKTEWQRLQIGAESEGG